MIKISLAIGMIIAASLASDRFIKIDDMQNYIIKDSSEWIMVEDTHSNLIWENIARNDSFNRLKWSDAIDYCRDLNLSGREGWRLPNRSELLSIIDYTQNTPAMDKDYFKKTTEYGFIWTSSSYSQSHAYYVSPNEGLLHYADKESGVYIAMCVWSE